MVHDTVKVNIKLVIPVSSFQDNDKLLVDFLTKDCAFSLPDANLVPSRAVQAAFEVPLYELFTTVLVTPDYGLIRDDATDVDKNVVGGITLEAAFCNGLHRVPDLTTMRLVMQSPSVFNRRCIMYTGPCDMFGFAFGNIIDFSKFIYRYEYNPGMCDKLGCIIKAEFEHDNRELTIHFRRRASEEEIQQFIIPALHGSNSKEFILSDDDLWIRYKIRVAYGSIHSVIVDGGPQFDQERPNETDTKDFYLRLRYPPKMFRVKPGSANRGRGMHAGRGRGRGGRGQHDNGNQPPIDPDPVRIKAKGRGAMDRVLTFLEDDETKFMLAQSRYMRLRFPKIYSFTSEDPRSTADDEEGAVNGHDSGAPSLTTYHVPTHLVLHEIYSRLNSRQKVNIFFGRMVDVTTVDHAVSPERLMKCSNLPDFGCNYAFQALRSRGYAALDLISEVFLKQIEEYANSEDVTDRNLCSVTLGHLTSAIDEHKELDLYDALEQLMNDFRVTGANIDTPRNCIRVRKIVVTPTRMLLMEPEVMMANRVTRAFNGEEWAMRVIFRDEDLRRIWPSAFKDETIFRERVWDIMLDGLVIGRLPDPSDKLASLRFRFLAWSNSQLRDNGCYMYANVPFNRFEAWYSANQQHLNKPGEQDMFSKVEPNLGPDRIVTGDIVRKCLGSFDHIRNVPKLMSRIGQCFTQTQRVFKLKADAFRVDDDVVGMMMPESMMNAGGDSDERYTFSDGIGRLSMKLAQKISEQLELHYTPSAYQIRFGGFKGMLTMDPRLDEKIKEGGSVEVVFRESMAKFEALQSLDFEVVKFSQPSPVTLNRPLIMILDQVTQKQNSESHKNLMIAVHSLLEKHLFAVADMLLDERKSALELHTRTPLTLDFQRMQNNGFIFTNEPFFRGLLLAIHRLNIDTLLHKQKIEIPADKGRTMYGVLDEAGCLQHGQVFVQYSEECNKEGANNVIKTLTGTVMVTKNPCLSPGDVRLFEAVHIEGLKHLVDVIVFPQHGPRPHTDEMAGSDLDGDEYAVFWMEELKFCKNEEPLNFPKVKPTPVPDITLERMVSFYIDYLADNCVGLVSSNHLAISDQKKKGIYDRVAISLAQKASVAVDFPKTGIPPEPVEDDERPLKYPDFMMRMNKQMYRSRRLNGQIYRKVQLIDDIVALAKGSMPVVPDPHLVVEGWEEYRPDAMHEMHLYYQRIQYLLDQYGIEDELQLISGHMIKIRNRFSDNEKDDFSYFNTEKLVELRINKIHAKVRERFFRAWPDLDTEDVMESPPDEVLKKASACYIVAYRYKEFGNCNRFLSFPWIFADILTIIKQRKIFGNIDELMVNPVMELCALEMEKKFPPSSSTTGSDTADSAWFKLSDVMRDWPIVKRYSDYYKGLDTVLLSLINWATLEGIFEPKRRSRRLGPAHICFMFLQYSAIDCSEADTQKLLRADQIPEDAAGAGRILCPGATLIGFIRYMASEAFRNASVISFDASFNTDYFLRDPDNWLLLHISAFKTYHHIALMGRFTSLHLTERQQSSDRWDEDETEPIRVVWPRDFVGQNPKYTPIGRAASSLWMQWSGVKAMEMRRVAVQVEQNGRRAAVVCVVGRGSIESRQKLRKILLDENLWHCTEEQKSPLEMDA